MFQSIGKALLWIFAAAWIFLVLKLYCRSKTGRHNPCSITEDRRRWGGWILSSEGQLPLGVIHFYRHLLYCFSKLTTSEEADFNNALCRIALSSTFFFFFLLYIFISMTFSNANQCACLPLFIFYIASANWPLCCEINSWEWEFWDVSQHMKSFKIFKNSSSSKIFWSGCVWGRI